MKLSTGKVAFPIEFDNGDKAVIYFNPNDRGIQERIQGFEASIEKRIKEIDLEKYKSRFEGNIPEIDLDNPEKLLEMSADELKALQAQVGGLIEVITLSPTAAIIINDEGKLIGLEGNRRFRNDVIVGNMLIVGVKGEEFASLNDIEAERYKKRFWEPEDISAEEIRQHMGFRIIYF